MKKLIPLIALLLLFILPSTRAMAQADSTVDLSYYFEDGGISESRHVFKLNIFTIYYGELPLHYEYVVSESFSVEAGVGLLLPYFVQDPILEYMDWPLIVNEGIGYSLWLFPKYYFRKGAPELNYAGIQFRQRNFNAENQKVIYTDLTVNYGVQLMLGRRIAIDYVVGAGVKIAREDPVINNKRLIGVSIPVQLKIGFFL